MCIRDRYYIDWEATNEAIEEQVARESYLQWLRDNERRHAGNSKSATVTSADLRATSEATSPSRAKNLVEEETKAARSSPKPSCSHTSEPLQYLVSCKNSKEIDDERKMQFSLFVFSLLQRLVAHPKEIVQNRAPLVNLSPPPT